MDWNDLRFVLAVSRDKTLAAAGKTLRVDPTTVGRRIVAIEAELGARLFDRTGDGYLLTPAGRIATAKAEEMELTTLSLAQQVQDSDGQAAGLVRLASTDSLIDEIIVPALPKLLSKYPALEVSVSSGHKILSIPRREVDVAVRFLKPTEPDTIGRKLGCEALAAYCAVGLDATEQTPLIGMAKELGENPLTRIYDTTFPGRPIAVGATAESSARNLTRAGMGISILTCHTGDSDPALKRALPQIVAKFDLWAVVHEDLHKTPRIQAVLDFLTEVFRENEDLLAGRCPLARNEVAQ